MRLRLLLISCAAAMFIGCAGYNHGYYSRQAQGRYHLVDAETESFGYKYLGYEEDLRSPIRGFVRDNGKPDFIFPYKEGKREGVLLFYVKQDQVINFFEANWEPSSVYPREIRSLTVAEKAIYEELLRRAGKAVSIKNRT